MFEQAPKRREPGYQIRLDHFEGPMDLLLHLIRRDKIDIYDIPISHITHEYLSYIEIMKELELEVAGEFFVMAATLMRIKVQMLLPKRAVEEEEEDPREELVRNLIEYRKFKKAADHLAGRESSRRDVFVRPVPKYIEEEDNIPKMELSLFDLMDAFKSILEDLKKEITYSVEVETHTVDEKIDFIHKIINSNSEILFTELGLRPRKRTKTGYSTAAGVLEEMADEHPIVPKILEWRTFSKLLSTYLRPLVTLVDDESRIHTTFDQTGAATGRLSTKDPNLQNIPIRGDRGPLVRKGFVAAPGCKLISADYSQIELRVLAHVAEDTALAKIFHDGRDVHTETSMMVFGVKEKDVTRDHRRKAKAINYGIIYGMGPFGFARRMGVTTEEAGLFIDRYLASFPEVSAWRERILVDAREHGYVSTIAGRVRRLAIISGRTDIAERAAINAPIQGSAADIIKKAMIMVEPNLQKARIEPGMILQIHDELLFEVLEDRVEDAKKIIKRDMESAWELSVPLEVDIGVGDNWAEAH